MNLRRPSGYAVAFCAVLLVGTLLRTYQFLTLDSLWADELSIALNVTRRGWWELLSTPLGYRMVAPVGFLAAEKLGVTLLGNTEAGLRLFPWLASIVALYLFWRLSTRFLGRMGQLGALSLFALSPALLWYARNAKQYSGDVLSILVLLLLAIRFEENKHDVRERATTALLGALAILISQPAVLVAAGLCVALFLRRSRLRELGATIPVVVGWSLAASITIATSLAVSSPDTRGFMTDAWKRGFFPAPWNSWGDVFWLPRRALAFTGFFVGLFRPDTALEVIVTAAYCALAGIALPRVMRRNPATAALLLVPPIVAVVASIFRILPLSGRLSIYIAPSLVILVFAGLERIRHSLTPKRRRWMAPLIVVPGLAPALILPLVLPPLNHRQPSRLVLEAMRSEWRPEDSIHVSYGGRRAMNFYGTALGMRRWSAGARRSADRGILREADILRGSPRAWYVSSSPRRCEIGTVLAYLDSIGSRMLVIPDPYGNRGLNETSAYLYALDDSARMARFSAATFPVAPCAEPKVKQRRGILDRWKRVMG